MALSLKNYHSPIANLADYCGLTIQIDKEPAFVIFSKEVNMDVMFCRRKDKPLIMAFWPLSAPESEKEFKMFAETDYYSMMSFVGMTDAEILARLPKELHHNIGTM